MGQVALLTILWSFGSLLCLLCGAGAWQAPDTAFALRQGSRVSMEDYATSFDVLLSGPGEAENGTTLRVLAVFDGHEVSKP